MIRTFAIQTLGCKVNQYESEQLASFLRGRGLSAASDPAAADLRVVNSCSVTVQAAGKSRQLTRRAVAAGPGGRAISLPQLAAVSNSAEIPDALAQNATAGRRARVVVTGCWATSDRDAAAALPGVDAVVGHDDDVAREFDRLLAGWQGVPTEGPADPHVGRTRRTVGTTALPLLGIRQPGRQRAYLKVQDGCDAHCTYCIIPTLRPAPWSKPVDDAVEEARRLVAAGHVELVLTGIFLGAYGQPTALRRRQPGAPVSSLGRLIEALCTRVPGLRRVRLSSLEPGDLSDELVAVLRAHPQVVPHFHLPLQSGSDALLRRMNRQYARDDYLRMIDRVRAAFDRPALTTDVIIGFPGETDAEFARTVEVVDAAGFVHVHAFPFSPRPGTAAARWTRQFVRGPVVNERMELLRQRADAHGLRFREQFVGDTVELLVEHERASSGAPPDGLRHGRCARYFDVHFEGGGVRDGDFVRVRVDRVTPAGTFGTLVRCAYPATVVLGDL